MKEDYSTSEHHPNHSRPVIPILISLMIGVASGDRFPGFGWAAYVGVPAGLIGLCFFIKKGKAAFGLPLVVFFLLGYLLIQPWVSPVFPSHHIIHFADSRKHQLTGIIEKDPTAHGNRLRFVLKSESLESNGISLPVNGRVRVTVRRIIPDLFAGDRISIFAKIRKIRNFNNHGGFDYKRHMAFRGICTSAYVDESRLTVLEKNTERNNRRILDSVRRRLSAFIDRNANEASREVLKALIVGDKTGVSQGLREAFNRSGTAHLLAISGLHIGIVAAVFFMLFRRGLAYIQPLLWSAWTHKGAAILSMLPVVAYGLIAGMSPSTQRAVIMVVIFLTAFLFEREHDPVNTLSLAAMTIILIHPPSLFSISFQLSFAAVFSILLGIATIRFKRAEASYRIVEKLISFFWVSFFATIGTIPIIMVYFNQISIVGIFANFIVVPIIGFLVTPIGLLSAFLYPVSIHCASFLIRTSAAILEVALELIQLFSDIPFAAIKTATPTLFEISCYYLMVWTILNMINVRTKENLRKDTAVGGSIPRSGVWERVVGSDRLLVRRGSILVLLIVLLAGSADAYYWINRRFLHDDLKVTIIDVGQGSASLLEFPGGYTLLIDGGGFSDNASFDVGERIIAPFLWRNKIMTVDTIILSHPNSDHLNGLLYIVRHFRIKQIWTNNDISDTKGYHKFMELIESKKIPVPVFKYMPRTYNVNGVTLQILYPPKDFLDRRDQDRWRTINNNSMVIKAGRGSTSFLFPGDIKARAEKELVEIAGDNLRSTVLIAPHHGSKSSSSSCFLDRVDPEVVIVSAGWENVFDFPHPSVLRRYNKYGSRILRTDHHGAVMISVEGASMEIRTTVKDVGN